MNYKQTNIITLFNHVICYFYRVCTSLEDLKGKPTKAVQFTTGTCEPDAPVPPKLSSKTKTSITLKWNVSLGFLKIIILAKKL